MNFKELLNKELSEALKDFKESFEDLHGLTEKTVMNLDDTENNASFNLGWIKALEHLQRVSDKTPEPEEEKIENNYIISNFLTIEETKKLIEKIKELKNVDYSTSIESHKQSKAFKINFKEE